MLEKLLARDGKLYRYMSILYSLLVLNLLWVITSLPVITIGASGTALFAAIRSVFNGSDKNEWRIYLSAFKKHFIQATLVWLGLLAAYLIVFLNLSNLNFFGGYYIPVLIVQFSILLQIIIINLFVFLLISRADNTIFTTVKTAWILGNRYFFISLGCIILIGIMLSLGSMLVALFLFLSGSISFTLIYFILDKVIEKHSIEC